MPVSTYPRWHAQVKTRTYGIFPGSAGKMRQHKQTSRTNIKNPSWPENCLCCGEDHGITMQNAVIQTCLLAPTLGGTRKLKPGHMEVSPVSAGKTRQQKQTSRTNTKSPSWPEYCLCCGEDHGITIPPHNFRQQYNQQRFCPPIR